MPQFYMTQKIITIIFILLIILTSFIACEKFGKKSPSEAIKDFYMLGNESRYVDAEQYLTNELKSSLLPGGGIKEFLDDFTKNGNLKKVKIFKEETKGQGSTIYFELIYNDGSSHTDITTLLFKDGIWKISNYLDYSDKIEIMVKTVISAEPLLMGWFLSSLKTGTQASLRHWDTNWDGDIDTSDLTNSELKGNVARLFVETRNNALKEISPLNPNLPLWVSSTFGESNLGQITIGQAGNRISIMVVDNNGNTLFQRFLSSD